MSANGSIIIGNAAPNDLLMFVWDSESGMRDLVRLLADEHGVEFPEIPNGCRCSWLRVEAISGDGTTIGGSLNDVEGIGWMGWIAHLDRPLVVTTGVQGDFNGNAKLDTADLDLLAKELQNDRNVELFDVNSDNAVDFSDRQHWVVDLANTYFGDANLDGQFDTNDLVIVTAAGFYETNDTALWSQGDWNGDGAFTTNDLVLALEQGGYEQGPRAAVSAVPEPSVSLLLVIGLVFLNRKPQRRN